MTDLDKVIKGLTTCLSGNFSRCQGDKECPYYELSEKFPHGTCEYNKMIRDALELLKEYKEYLQNDLKTLKEIKRELELERAYNFSLQHLVKRYEMEKGWDECPDRMSGCR